MSKETYESPELKPNRQRRVTGKRVRGAGLAVLALSAGAYLKHSDDTTATRLRAKISDLDAKVSGLEAANRSQQLVHQREMRAEQRVAAAVASTLDASPIVVTGSTLRRVKDLPDYGEQVSLEKEQLLHAATVKLGRRLKGSNYPWYEVCTGVKVSLNGQTYVATAGHCFMRDDDPTVNQIANPQKGGPDDLPRVRNITALSNYEFAVLDPQVQSYQREQKPMASVAQVAVGPAGISDLALLQIGRDETAFSGLSSVRLEDLNTLTMNQHVPIPGQQAAIFGIPESSMNQPLATRGVYLGRISGADISTVAPTLDLVGITAATDSSDACDYGASGSMTILADGTVSGPLSFRNNIGYGLDHRVVSPDQSLEGKKDRLKIESLLDTNLDQFETICGFDVPPSMIVPQLAQVIQNPVLTFLPGK